MNRVYQTLGKITLKKKKDATFTLAMLELEEVDLPSHVKWLQHQTTNICATTAIVSKRK